MERGFGGSHELGTRGNPGTNDRAWFYRVAAPAAEGGTALRPLSTATRAFEREYLLRALSLAGGKRMRTAEMLGISRKNLWEKLRSHGISDSDLDE